MDNVLEFLKGFNLQTIISVGLIFLYFTRDIKSEMKLLEAKIDSQANRSDRLYEMFIELVKERK